MTKTTKKYQYRVTFTREAAGQVDPFELAWLLSKHECEVVAKNERPMLFVKAGTDDMRALFHDLNVAFGCVVEDVEVPECGEYVSVLYSMYATHVPVADCYTRFVAEDMGADAIERSIRLAVQFNEATGEAVQIAYANGYVHSFIDRDGRGFGNLATCG